MPRSPRGTPPTSPSQRRAPAAGGGNEGRFDVIPLPRFAGAGKGGTLGGHTLVISVYSKNPAAALKLVDDFSTREAQKLIFLDSTRVPPLLSVFDDAEVKKQCPFAGELKQGVAQAKSRRASPVHSRISQAIYEDVDDALAGRTSPAEALKAAQQQVTQALETFGALTRQEVRRSVRRASGRRRSRPGGSPSSSRSCRSPRRPRRRGRCGLRAPRGAGSARRGR